MNPMARLILVSIILASIVRTSTAQDAEAAAKQSNQQQIVIALHARPAIRGVATKLSIVIVGKSGKIEKNFKSSVRLESSEPAAVPSSFSFSKTDEGFKVVEPITFNFVGNHTITASTTIDGQAVNTSIQVAVIPNVAEFACGIIVGDVDADGSITPDDIVALETLNMCGLATCNDLMVGDLNRNGRIDDEDVETLALLVDAIGDNDIIIPPPGSEPCIIEIIQPEQGEFVNRDDVTLRFRVIGDAEPGPIETLFFAFPNVAVFANRPLEPVGRPTIPAGTELIQPLGDLLIFHDDGSIELPLRKALPIGQNTLTVLCSSIDGHVSCAHVTFTVTGVDVIHGPSSITLRPDAKNPGQGGVLIAATELEPDATDVSLMWSDTDDGLRKKKQQSKYSPDDRRATVLLPPTLVLSGPTFTSEATLMRTTGGVARVNHDLHIVRINVNTSFPRFLGVIHDPRFVIEPGQMTLAPRIVIPRDENGLLWRARLRVNVNKVRPPANVNKDRLEVRDGPNANLSFLQGSKGLWEVQVQVIGVCIPRPDLANVLAEVTIDSTFSMVLISTDDVNEVSKQPKEFVDKVNECIDMLNEWQRILNIARGKARGQRSVDEELAVRISDAINLDFGGLLTAGDRILSTHYRITTMVSPDDETIRGLTPAVRDLQNNRYNYGDTFISPTGMFEDIFCRVLMHELIHSFLYEEVNANGGLVFDADNDGLHDRFRDDDPNTPADARRDQQEAMVQQLERDLVELGELLDKIGGR